MEKALEILKKRKRTLLLIKASSVLTKKESIEIDEDIKQIDEAIAELEALQQRICEGCKYRSFLDKTLTNKVTNGFCMENGFFTKVGFCCNRYEAKDEQ